MRKHLLRVMVVASVFVFISATCFAAEPKTPAVPVAPVKPVVVAPQKAVPVKKAELVDINTATKGQLMALPGIGEATAQKIIGERPYAKKDQLKIKKILSPAEYDRIKDRIIAKQLPEKKK